MHRITASGDGGLGVHYATQIHASVRRGSHWAALPLSELRDDSGDSHRRLGRYGVWAQQNLVHLDQAGETGVGLSQWDAAAFCSRNTKQRFVIVIRKSPAEESPASPCYHFIIHS